MFVLFFIFFRIFEKNKIGVYTLHLGVDDIFVMLGFLEDGWVSIYL